MQSLFQIKTQIIYMLLLKSKDSEMFNEESVKEKLREKVNGYMIPRRIIVIDDFSANI